MFKKSVFLIAAAIVSVVGLNISLSAPTAYADDEKVMICHRKMDAKKPYVFIDINESGADAGDGKGKDDNDHTSHGGDVATSETVADVMKKAKTDWGDIIPPHGDYPGLNWVDKDGHATIGQAMWYKDCQFVTTDGQGGDGNGGNNGGGNNGGGTTTTPETPATTPVTTPAPTAQVATTPVAAVNAGSGAATPFTTVIALVASALVAGYGVVRLRKFNS